MTTVNKRASLAPSFLRLICFRTRATSVVYPQHEQVAEPRLTVPSNFGSSILVFGSSWSTQPPRCLAMIWKSTRFAMGRGTSCIACLVGIFKPVSSPIAAPIYAVLEGLCLGAISQVIELRYHGIVVNAMLLTFGVLGLMLMLHTTRTIRVTDKLVKGVLVATAAVALVYVVDLMLNMFGTRVAYIHEAGAIGIGISLVIVGIAAFNLLIDFAVIEEGVSKGSPRFMEWYCGMALLVTLVWLYLEILRLLSKLRGKN